MHLVPVPCLVNILTCYGDDMGYLEFQEMLRLSILLALSLEAAIFLFYLGLAAYIMLILPAIKGYPTE